MKLFCHIWPLGLLFLVSAQDQSGTVRCPDSEVMCDRNCDFGFKIDANGCRLCACEEKTCQDVQCPVGKVCQVHTLTASAHKISRCVDTRFPERCWSTMDTGPCRDPTAQYYYNTEKDTCEPLLYGGCQGNDNRFATLQECQDFCGEPCPDFMCTRFCENGYKVDERGCTSCTCVDDSSIECPDAMCQLFCDYGLKTDQDGCNICECEPCAQVMCQMYCDGGFQTDTDGCPICVCNEPEPVSGSCPPMTCQLYCENGMPLDADGCPVCQCLDLDDEDLCPPVTCQMYCEHGFVTDTNGCDICECTNTVNMLNPATVECGEVMCQRYCANGFVSDERGCELCECKVKADSCPDVMCQMYCEDGLQKDQNGCDICRCQGWGSLDICDPVECQLFCDNGFEVDDKGCKVCRCVDLCEPVECQMYCEFGFMKNGLGCKKCKCNEDPCGFVDCPAGQKCIVEGDSTLPTCIDEDIRSWCNPIMCTMFCEHGFKTDETGCEMCTCLQEPKPSCSDLMCQQFCHHGYKFNQHGCRTCECRANPCDTKACKWGFVCETREANCPTCPSRGVCIGHSQVQRVEITLSYNHPAVDYINDYDFRSIFRRRMHYLLDIDEDYIRAIVVTPESPLRTTVTFHAVSYGAGDIVESYESFKADIMAHMEGTALDYEGVTFIPDHKSVSAAYHQSPNFEHDDDDSDEDDYDDDSAPIGLIVGCTVAGAVAVALLVVVIVFVVKANNKKKGMGKPDVAYKKAPDSQPISEKELLPEV